MLQIHEEAEKKISPEIYSKYLNNINIYEICLIDVKAEINRDLIQDETSISISFNDNYKINKDRKHVNYDVKFDLIATIADTKQQFLSISAKYNISFITKGKIPSEFWSVYENISLPNQVWVYFRELIQNFTSRMNIPPLILPLFFPKHKLKSK
jgi:preprotein translocase subunit SecB